MSPATRSLSRDACRLPSCLVQGRGRLAAILKRTSCRRFDVVPKAWRSALLPSDQGASCHREIGRSRCAGYGPHVHVRALLQVIGALGPLLVRDAGGGWASLGTLMAPIRWQGSSSRCPPGSCSRVFGPAVLLTGVGLMGPRGTLLAMAPDFAMALVGRIVSGIGGTLLTITGAKMVWTGSAVRPSPSPWD